MKSIRFIFLSLIMVLSCLDAFSQQKPEIKIEWIDTTGTSGSEDMVFKTIEQLPSYPGGTTAMKKAIKAKFGSATIEKPGVEPTRVFVAFTVNEKGEIIDPKFLKAAHLKQGSPELDAQVFEFLKSMPKWIPGRQNGKPASATLTYPFVFWIEEK